MKILAACLVVAMLCLILVCLHLLGVSKQYIGPAACGSMAGVLVFVVRRKKR